VRRNVPTAIFAVLLFVHGGDYAENELLRKQFLLFLMECDIT
jgi:hypothetical protein